jgi:hypothetical protein
MTEHLRQNVSRECGWCEKVVRERADGRLAVHKWPVGWDRDRDKPIMGRCVGSGTTEADLEAAKS